MRIKIKPDKNKANSLRNMAELTLQRLEKTDQEKYATNTLTDYYDIIHKLMEAISLLNGIKIKGDGAHQQLIDYLKEIGIINESTRIFLQDLREKRNRVSYEGLMIRPEYIKSNKERIISLIKRLNEK
ncbi:MAG: hypothetical protein V1740_06925 [Candidatus Woesearchaeota archaeon]